MPFFGNNALLGAAGAGGVVAAGGTITEADGYRYHTFTTVGASDFDVLSGGAIDALLVAGGGGGGQGGSATQQGGGGGAGGLVWAGSLSIVPGEWDVIVGAGGTGGTRPAGDGGNSTFYGLTAIGGGGGGGYSPGYRLGRDGGSGGGGARDHFSTGNAGGTALQPLAEGRSGDDGYGHNGAASATNAAGGGGAGGAPNGEYGGVALDVWEESYAPGGNGNGQGAVPTIKGAGGRGRSPNGGDTSGVAGIVIIRYRI